jgi:nitrite reductase/ring-hydroxylating ferredoxin subunit
MKRCIIFLGLLLLTVQQSCKEIDYSSIIPYVPINRVLNLGNPQFSPLNAVGGYIVLPDEGSRGLIVIRSTTDDVAAFDRHCTYDGAKTCGIANPDNSAMYAVCACCGSQWLMLNGQVIKGPAAIPLKSYQTSFNGLIVTITN